MLVALFSLLLATAPVPPHGAAEGEIVVMAHKLDRWTGKFEIRGARRQCATKTSSGDPDIDAIGCRAFLDCADRYQSETDASDERGIDRSIRRARKQGLIADMRECIADRRALLLTQLHERRAPPDPS